MPEDKQPVVLTAAEILDEVAREIEELTARIKKIDNMTTLEACETAMKEVRPRLEKWYEKTFPW